MRAMRVLGAVWLLAWAGILAGAGTSPAQSPRDAFLNLIDRPRVPLAPWMSEATVTDGISEFHFTYASENNQTVPGILLKQAASTGRRPVVIALHGTNGNKNDLVPLLKTLVRRGFIGISIDGRYHGDRALDAPKEAGMTAYETAILHAWRNNAPDKLTDKALSHEHPFFYDTVWDVMRLVDYLQTRNDVDASRIGLYGVSKGGIEAYLAIAVDPRIAAAVPCISVESFRWADDNNAWQPRIETIQKPFDLAAKEAGIARPDAAFVKSFYARVVPGIEDVFDGPSIIPLAAPRPLMAINGEKDPRTPPAGLKLATDAIQAAYAKAGVPERFVLLVQPNTAHKVSPEAERAGADFLAKWLLPP